MLNQRGFADADAGMRRVLCARSRVVFALEGLSHLRRDSPGGSASGSSVVNRDLSPIGPRSGLTLIELIVAIGIIGVLAAITVGIARGIHVRAGISKARIEIAAIAQGLEAYRARYGDYPQTSSAATMLQCLLGKCGPTGSALTDKAIIEMARFSTLSGVDPFVSTSAVLIDPFGKAYNYAYKTGASWRNPSFVLYSGGPDGLVAGTFPADGFIDATFENAFTSGAGNPDNIYHDRN